MKIGLALGSGSARGWAHIGVIEGLAELGITPSIICGSSIGALVGAAYVSGKLDRLRERVLGLTRLNMAMYFHVRLSGRGVVSKKKLHAFLADCVSEEGRLIESLPLRYAAVATELKTGREFWFRTGPVLDAVWASIALPGLFPPVAAGNRWLLDGGLVNPVPVSVCRALGADTVIAVNLNGDVLGRHLRLHDESRTEGGFPYVHRHDGLGKIPSLFGTVASAVDIVQDRITRSRMAGDPPDILLAPRLSHMGLLDFYRAEESIREGRACVMRMQSGIETLFGSEMGKNMSESFDWRQDFHC